MEAFMNWENSSGGPLEGPGLGREDREGRAWISSSLSAKSTLQMKLGVLSFIAGAGAGPMESLKEEDYLKLKL